MKQARSNPLRLASLVSTTLLLAACGSDDTSSTSTSGANGSGGNTTQTSANTTSTSASTANASTTGSGGSDSTTTTGSNSGGGSGGEGFAELGVCGVRSAGTVTEDSFETYEEHYLLGDEGLGEEVCVVRFDVTRVGDGPGGCDEFAGQQQSCLWTHLVEFKNPRVLVDQDSACEQSELAMTAEAIAEIEGQQLAYGYVFEYQGHNSVLMGYDEAAETWGPVANAGWNEASGAFQFDRRDGFCGY